MKFFSKRRFNLIDWYAAMGMGALMVGGHIWWTAATAVVGIVLSNTAETLWEQ